VRLRILSWIGVVWGAFILISGAYHLVAGDIDPNDIGAGLAVAWAIGGLLLFAGIRTLRSGATTRTPNSPLHEFAREYTAAWCSGNPARVARFYAVRGALTIYGGPPAAGRAAITESARGFMTAFPDMVVKMDRLELTGGGLTEYHWTLIGTNTGPGGTGNAVKISGYEEWLIGDDGLIADSQGHFDQAEYDRQLRGEGS
jgi:hypothetical protein